MNCAAKGAALRRAPAALAASLQMDKALRCLFVEGPTDRLFLMWVSGDVESCRIETIDSIDIEGSSGGHRARAVWLANYLRTELDSDPAALGRVRVFVDADFDYIDGKVALFPLIYTDGRSMESYFLRLSYFKKIFHFALLKVDIDYEAVFREIVNILLILAATREVDRRRYLCLPFQNTRYKTFIDVNSSGIPNIRLHDMISNLLHKAGLRSSMTLEVVRAIEEAVIKLESYTPAHVVHGHDLENVLGETLESLKFPRRKVKELMRATFARRHVADYPNLSSVVAFIRAA